MELRWYQEEAVEAALETEARARIIGLPTGAGKSAVIGELIKRTLADNPDARILMGVHTQELVEQNAEALLEFVPYADIGICCSGLGKREFDRQIVFGTVGTLANQPAMLGKRDLMLIDECHRVGDGPTSGYQKLIAAMTYQNPDMGLIGLSATYWRLGEGELTDGATFEEVCYTVCIGEDFMRLVDDGFLAPLTSKAPAGIQVDLSRVRMTAGEFNQSEAADAVRERLAEVIPDTLARSIGRKKGMIFVSGIQNVETVNQMLLDMGERSTFLTGKTPRKQRRETIAAYKKDPASRWIVSDGILTTGFNVPEVDVIVLLKATTSSALNVQIMGRGTRMAPWAGKIDCLILDYVGNIVRCGPINDPVIPKRKGDPSGDAPPAKVCPECESVVHASARICPECFHEFPPPKPKIDRIASAADPMLRVKAKKIDRKRVWLWHEKPVAYRRVKDTAQREYVRVEMLTGFSFLISQREFAAYGIEAQTIEGAVQWLNAKGLPAQARLWDVSDGKFPRHVKTDKKPTAQDIYWFPAIDGSSMAHSVDVLATGKEPDADVVKRCLRKGGTRLIPPEAVYAQLRLLARALRKHDVSTEEGIRAYIEGLFKGARDSTGDEEKEPE